MLERVGETAAPSVEQIVASHFRNYSSVELALSPGFNVLAGANGQGKTNLLEAVHLVATTRLLRGQRDAEAIQDGFDRAEVKVLIRPFESEAAIILERGIRKRATLNRIALPRAADLLGRVPCVSISAMDMEIARGEPSERRLFLDLEMSASSPAYLRHLTVYKRALEQRNAIVREAAEWPQPDRVWEPWEDQMAEHGAALRDARNSFVRELLPKMSQFHSEVGGGECVSVSYRARDEAASEAELRTCLQRSRQTDIARRSTGVGPHRDELCFEVEGRDARLFGSQGQQRTTVIALKLACLELGAERGAPPLLLLDDIFSDLDGDRRSNLVDIVLKLAGQAILTCTEASAAGPSILERASVFKVRSGVIEKQ